MKSLYDFPKYYDHILRSSIEQIKIEVNSIDRLITDAGFGKSRILDIACGTCAHGIALAQMGHEVAGIDLAKNMLTGAENLANEASVKLDFFHSDIVDFELQMKDFQCAIFMSETFPLITEMDDIRRHMECVHNHLVKDGLYIIDIDTQTGKIRSESSIWGNKVHRINGTDVEVWFEDLPGDSSKRVNKMIMHCRIHGTEIVETADHWTILAYTPDDYVKLFASLTDWQFDGFYNWDNLSRDISNSKHFFAVLRKI